MQLTPYHTSPFDAIRQLDENGQEYWSARAMQNPLGYATWENFKETIERAMVSCKNNGHNPEDHFRDATKGIKGGKGVDMVIKDYHLTRLACYLTAMNGDPRKQEIAAAQWYFVTKTREAELTQSAQPVTQEQIAHLQAQIDQIKGQKRLAPIDQAAKEEACRERCMQIITARAKGSRCERGKWVSPAQLRSFTNEKYTVEQIEDALSPVVGPVLFYREPCRIDSRGHYRLK